MLTFFFTTLSILSIHSSPFLPFTNAHRLLSSALTSSPDTLVNTYTTDKQYLPASTTLSDGKVLVAWESLNQGANGGGIYSQKFNIDTTPSGVETRLDSSSTEFQTVSTITALSNGQYIVAYQSTLLIGGTNVGQFAQVYNADNTAYGSRYRINTYSALNPNTAMTSFSSGKYIIVWKRDGLNSGGYGIYAQIFNNDGTTFGSSTGFKVSTFASGNQARPAVAELIDGKFVILWQSINQDTDSLGIFGQMYHSDGSTYGTEFQVNTYTTNDQSSPKVAGLDSGGFVVTWQSNNQDTSGWGIYAQIYNGDGTRYKSEFQVNTYVLGAQQNPVVTALTGGGFVIVWQSDGQDSSGNGVYGQKYNSDGTTFEWEFQVNTYISGEQSAPIVVSIGNGFVVVWQSAGQDGSDFGIFAKWFTCPSATPNLYDNQCYLICPSTAQYSYNGACQQACPSTAPYIYNFECYTTCPSEAPNVNSANNCYAEYQQKWANSMNIFTSIALKFFSSINSSSSNYVLIASFSAMLLYIRYLNLDYTSPVMIMFMNQEIINVSFGINAPQSVENGLPNHTLPEEFERYNIYSSFLYNCWDTLMTGLIVLFITFVVMLLTKFTKRWSKVHAVFKMLSTATKWNIPLLVLCGNFNKIIVYACIEMKTLHFDTAGAVMSFLICLLFLGLCLYAVVKILIIARNIMKSQENPGLKRDWKDYTILYEGYKKTSYFTLTYLPIFYLRNLIIDLIITTAYASPMFQTVVMVILSVAMLLYLARYRPLKSVLQMLQLCFNELLLFAVNICVLVLASLNPESDSYATNRDNLGEAIIILNVIFSTANVVFIALESLKWLIVLRKRVKAGKARGLTSFMQILKFVVMPTSGLEHSMSIAKSATIVPSNTSSPVIKPEYADSARIQFVKTEQDFASGQTSASKLELLMHKNSSVMMRNLEEARLSFKPLNVSEVSILSKTLVQQEKMDISTINLPEKEVEVENKDIKVEDFSWRDLTDNNNNKSFELNSSVGKEIQLKLGQRVVSEVFEYTSRKRRRHAKSDVSEPAEDNRRDNRIRRSSLGYYI